MKGRHVFTFLSMYKIIKNKPIQMRYLYKINKPKQHREFKLFQLHGTMFSIPQSKTQEIKVVSWSAWCEFNFRYKRTGKTRTYCTQMKTMKTSHPIWEDPLTQCSYIENNCYICLLIFFSLSGAISYFPKKKQSKNRLLFGQNLTETFIFRIKS